jgi:hypothetical protein
MAELDEFELAEIRTARRRLSEKILNLLEKIRSAANVLTQRRWIWELIQNAKDSAYYDTKVEVHVALSTDNVRFGHTGDVFTTNDIVSIVEQTSSKDRAKNHDEKAKITGKYGTGFATTHLLSEKVRISSYQKAGSKMFKFNNLLLDRTGSTLDEIFDGISQAQDFYSKENRAKNFTDVNDFEPAKINTHFEYVLENEYSKKYAKSGIDDLVLNCPLLLVFIDKIHKVTIELDGDQLVFERVSETESADLNGTLICIQKTSQTGVQLFNYLRKASEEATICIQVEDFVNFEPIAPGTNQPKLFCDLPLIGSESFPFPVFINSPFFNPDEPRSSLMLLANSESIMPQVDENKSIITAGTNLYLELLESLSHLECQKAFNLCTVPSMANSALELDHDWYNEDVLKTIHEAILTLPLVATKHGMRSISGSDQDITIIVGGTSGEIHSLYQLVDASERYLLPLQEVNEDWARVIRKSDHKLSLKGFQKTIENNFADFQSLATWVNMDLDQAFGWYNQYLDQILGNDDLRKDANASEIKVLFNHNLSLKAIKDLEYCADLKAHYLDVDHMLSGNLRTTLVHNALTFSAAWTYRVKNSETIINEIFEALKSPKIEDQIRIAVSTFIIERGIGNCQNDKLVENTHTLNGLLSILDKTLDLDESSTADFEESWYRYAHRQITKHQLLKVVSAYDRLAALDQYVSTQGQTGIGMLEMVLKAVVIFGYKELLDPKDIRLFPVGPNGYFKDLNTQGLSLLGEDLQDDLLEIIRDLDVTIEDQFIVRELFILPEFGIIAKNLDDYANKLTKKVEEIVSSKITKEKYQDALTMLFTWLESNESWAKTKLRDLYHQHWELLDKGQIADAVSMGLKIRKSGINEVLLEKFLSDPEAYSEFLKHQSAPAAATAQKPTLRVSIEEIINSGGVTNQSDLDTIVSRFIGKGIEIEYPKEYSAQAKFDYVTKLIQRTTENVFKLLTQNPAYSLEGFGAIEQRGALTTFQIKKHGKPIWVVCRPSDLGKILFYHPTEKQALTEPTSELWLDNGVSVPEMFTLGNYLIRNGINEIKW